MKISLIIPTIHPDRLLELYKNFINSCKKHQCELIAVGPYFPPQEMVGIANFKFIRDFGSPSRCLQIASLIAEGEFITWCPDDVKMGEDALDKCIEYFEANLTENDGMNLTYSEGENFAGTQSEEESYWIAHTHPDLRLAGIKDTWRTAALFLYKTKTFHQMGGLDCQFEHINLNAHDLAFAVQGRHGKIVNSPCKVFAVNWNPNPYREEYIPILSCYHQNDSPRMKHLYSNPNAATDRDIKLDNWKNQPALWPRRFKV
jgi:hypothetical protein